MEGNLERQKEEVVSFAQEVYSKIDFPLLVILFNKKLGRAMRRGRDFSPLMIYFDPDVGHSSFSGDSIVIGLQELIHEGSPGRKLEVLLMIIHEMAHYFSLGLQDESLAEHGVSLVETSTSESISGEAMNEAITEHSAMEIARVYIAQTGEGGYFYDNGDGENLFAKIGSFAYPNQTRALGLAISKIAQSQGVSESLVWESFQHAYYNNTNVAMGQLYTALKTALGKDATSLLVHTTAENMEDPEVFSTLLKTLKPES